MKHSGGGGGVGGSDTDIALEILHEAWPGCTGASTVDTVLLYYTTLMQHILAYPECQRGPS